ncbi:RNA-binding S4 domain-containing protein [Ligilactobacillus saerimneri]|uniref:RQC P-site tRNA stabilizing factor n=2 Tax=Ligilactobacillus saerimneri TaxID=228229 RepID=M5J3X5_9LACO|nr:RNA-binding S4 domain-containing protein [Ligilactobacillus saerimneri]EKW98353.1 heat shock protein [Ligilactobacillus saerimneri 30a]MBU5310330.1 RNA-binding S4 domain-containing protein [Ligilactobacillus saerimneri]MCZ0892327.1 RNA-binding S4 domain-containing protein [Ligilactobacillus saerimneri]MDI9206435.1 RNA-binding S4 domain-containing protein [Ligilactobacillus saerimneri]MDY4003622.1 RNA-binding S4 domain-containing protein [Ligilactobacillus saerimneri]
MRLDKFLKISRIIKRRTVAKEIADQGRVTVNGKQAKSSTKVAIGDIVVIVFGNKTLTIKVKELRETTKKGEADSLFELISEEYKEDYRI